MNLLAIDTAQTKCSAAVSMTNVQGGDQRLEEQSESLGRGHAERLMGMIEDVLSSAGIGYGDLDRVAVTTGPGSFTGVRVGLSAARGLALALDCEIVGINAMAAIALGAKANQPIAVVMDARRGQVYHQIFTPDGEPISEPAVSDVDSVRTVLEAHGQVSLTGSGAELVTARFPGLAQLHTHAAETPEIAAVAQLGLRADPSETAPSPLYLRPPDAKPQAALAAAG